jgi:hypothetical protein
MNIRFLNIMLILFLPSCSVLNSPELPTFDIKVANTKFSQNKFSANVFFDNKLGRQVYIIDVACMDNGHFIPNFVLQRFKGNEWIDFGSPGCVALAVGPTSLASDRQFSTTVAMLCDTALDMGTYRLRFDIREEDISKQIPSENLLSNSFVISN